MSQNENPDVVTNGCSCIFVAIALVILMIGLKACFS